MHRNPAPPDSLTWRPSHLARDRPWIPGLSTFTRTLLDVEHAGRDSWRVRNRLEGNFPGGVVDLRYQFTLEGANISRLSIAP